MCCNPPTIPKVAMINMNVFVDCRYGKNHTAELDNPNRPFRSLDNAISAAPVGYVITVRPGTYTCSASLLNKSLYAEMGVTIRVLDSAVFSGAYIVSGYADIVIDTPINYIHFRLKNIYNKTYFECNSILDTASKLVTLSLAVPITQLLIIKVAIQIKSTSQNLHGVIYVNTVTTTVTGVSLYCPALISTVSNNVITTYGNFSLYVDNIVTPGTAVKILLGTNILNIGNIGNLSNFAENGIVSSGGQNVINLVTCYAKNGAIFTGGRNTLNANNMGTSFGQLTNGIFIDSEQGFNVINVTKVFAHDFGIAINTSPLGENTVINIGTIGDPDVYPAKGMIINHTTEANNQSNITCDIVNIFSGITALDLTDGGGLGKVLMKGTISSMSAVTNSTIGTLKMNSPFTILNLMIPHLLAEGDNKMAIQLLEGELNLTVNSLTSSADACSFELAGILCLTVNNVSCVGDFLKGESHRLSRIIVNANLVEARSAINFRGESDVNLNIHILKTTQECVVLRNSNLMKINYSGVKMTSGLNYPLIINDTTSPMTMAVGNAISSTDGPAIILSSTGNADNTLDGVFNNDKGPVIEVSHTSSQVLRIRNSTLQSPVGTIKLPIDNNVKLILLGIMTTNNPTFVEHIPNLIVPNAALIFAGDI